MYRRFNNALAELQDRKNRREAQLSSSTISTTSSSTDFIVGGLEEPELTEEQEEKIQEQVDLYLQLF